MQFKRKKLGNVLKNPLSFIDNSLYLFRPLSNKITVMHPLINAKNGIKTFSAKTRDTFYKTKNRNYDLNYNHNIYLLYDFNNKKKENKQKEEILRITNSNENNFNNINLINLIIL